MKEGKPHSTFLRNDESHFFVAVSFNDSRQQLSKLWPSKQVDEELK